MAENERDGNERSPTAAASELISRELRACGNGLHLLLGKS